MYIRWFWYFHYIFLSANMRMVCSFTCLNYCQSDTLIFFLCFQLRRKECRFFPRLFKLFRLHSNKRSRSYICHGDSASLKNKLLIQRKSYTANYIILYWSRRPKPKWKTRIDGKKERKTERMKGIIVVYI